jgi:DNA-binding transcriptional regulator GbsR (MarR family)
MGGIIDKIIRFYQMRSEALGIVVGDTGKALREAEREKKDNEETEKLKSFAKNMTCDVNNMLKRFYFRKERKKKRCQRLSDEEVTAMADFVNFTKVLAVSVSSLLNRLRKNETFEEKLDEELKQLETHVKKRIKEFDEVLEDALSGRGRMFIKRLAKHAGNIISGFVRILRIRDVALAIAKRKKLDRPLKESSQNIENYQVETSNLFDSQLENLCNGLNINSVNGSRESSKNLMRLRA